MKSLLTLLMLFLIPIACAAESQPIEPRVKPAYPAKAEKKGIPGQVKEVRAAMEKWRYIKGKPSSNNIITIHFKPGPPCVEVPAPNQPGSIQSSGVPFR